MSEADLQLKLRTARWFWKLGASTLLRVRLTSFQAKPKKGKAALSDLADLDVLGTEVATDFRLRYRAAECKSGKAGAKELFWLRGVLDYFDGEEGYLVLQHDRDRQASLRELTRRLDLGIITFNDFESLYETYGEVDEAAADVLFSKETVARVDQLLANPPKDLERLTDYTLRFFWQIPQHRNLQQTIGFLTGAKGALDPGNPAHQLLFAELVYRYCLALFAACEAVVKRGYPNLPTLLPAYLHGGELGLREAQQRVRSVKELQEDLEGKERLELAATFSEVPPYNDALLDVVTRLTRRPQSPTAMLRHLQVAAHAGIALGQPAAELLTDYDPIAAKLVNDVAAFLVRASGIDVGHRQALASALNGQAEAAPTDSAEVKTEPRKSGRAEAEQLPISEAS